MSKFRFYKLALIFVFCVLCAPVAWAQTDDAQVSPPEKNFKRGGSRSILRELGLTAEQLQKIRALNAERKPIMIEAQRRMREAMRKLDSAIYADSVNETEIENRLKELQTAQTEIARIKARDELELRKILTPEQLVKFRELRQRFADKRTNFQNRRRNSMPADEQNNFNRRGGRRVQQNSQNQ